MKKWALLASIALAGIATASQSMAALLNVTLGYPQISYNNSSAVALNYAASNHLFTITATPSLVVFVKAESPKLISGTKTLQIQALVDNTGALIGTAGGNDLVLTGTVTEGTNTYSGVLLTGTVKGFGFLEGGATDFYDLLFTPTGGSLAGLFCGDISVQVTSGFSTFNNDFTVAFNGQAKGTVGSEDTTPPTITCPGNIVAECHTDTNGLPGAYVSYPTPVVTDNCDPNPTITCTPPSGSFFPLPPSVASTNYTVTCVAADAAGNTNFCSFTITVQDTLAPQFADTNNPVISFTLGDPITLTNDPGDCYATFTFPVPTATDNCCPLTIAASVSAVDENGAVIPLTDLGNGMLQGQFPVDVTGSNVVTVTASDGRGNSTQHQVAIVVVDKDPPTIVCADQTVSFKPILTNALSCIEADFDSTCIQASNYLWFSSVISSSGCLKNNSSYTVHIFDQTILLAVDSTNISLDVPDAYITFSNGVATTTTVFTNGQWVTTARTGSHGNTFAAGLAWQLPFDLNDQGGKCWGRDQDSRNCFRRHVNSATWCARFAVDTPGVVVQWQWSAVVNSKLTNDFNALCVKPVDDSSSSCWRNNDPAGSCEKFKSFLSCGGRGRGRCSDGSPDCTGILSDCKRANLGQGAVCLGAVEFAPPQATDNCGKPVSVVCTPPSGSVLGPGVYPVVCVATDSSGNSNQCSFNLTVLSPLQVVFDTPSDDNLDDNTSQPDVGFTDMNCPDDPSTTEIVTRFCSGDKILHSVRLLDCNGNDVTCSVGPYVTVHIDVTERQGTYDNSVLVTDVAQNYACVGSPGGILVLNGCSFQYNLDTKQFESGTVNNNKFFRSCVWVEYNSSPGIPAGMEDVVLESK